MSIISQKKKEQSKLTHLIDLGSNIAGSGTGAICGFLIGGPVGAIAGAVAGPTTLFPNSTLHVYSQNRSSI